MCANQMGKKLRQVYNQLKKKKHRKFIHQYLINFFLVHFTLPFIVLVPEVRMVGK